MAVADDAAASGITATTTHSTASRIRSAISWATEPRKANPAHASANTGPRPVLSSKAVIAVIFSFRSPPTNLSSAYAEATSPAWWNISTSTGSRATVNTVRTSIDAVSVAPSITACLRATASLVTAITSEANRAATVKPVTMFRSPDIAVSAPRPGMPAVIQNVITVRNAWALPSITALAKSPTESPQNADAADDAAVASASPGAAVKP